MTVIRCFVGVSGVLTVFLLTTTANAQSLQAKLTAKELARPVRVIQDAPWPDVRGRLLKAEGETVRLLVDGRSVDLPLARVQRIDVSGDRLLNGAAIGAVVMGGWCAAICGQGLTRRDDPELAIILNGALGALIGAGIDALIGRGKPIYIRPASRGSGLQIGIRF